MVEGRCVSNSDASNAVPLELTPGFYYLEVAPSVARTHTDRRVCVPFRPTCVGNEDNYHTYRSASHGEFGARVEVF